MAKDWESFKEEQVAEATINTRWELGNLEKRISSPIERIMYVMLNKHLDWAVVQGRATLEMQKRIGKYTADFCFIYQSNLGEEVKFIIECDGHDFHEKTKQQAQHDKKRDRYFAEEGFIVLRYTGSEIVNNPKNLTDAIFGVIVKKDGAC